MAVDTAGERASLMRLARPFIFRHIPDGSIDQADRETLAMKYSGILSAVLAIPAAGNAKDIYNTFTIDMKFNTSIERLSYDL